MPRIDATPAPQEIEQQLGRMLMSPIFTEAATQAQLLEYLVNNTLKGNTVTEKTIIADLFPFYARESPGAKPSNIVRVFKQKLFERLDEYYDGDGAGDLVLIALLSKPRRKGYKPPPGEAYRTVFRYNPERPVDQDYRRGLYHLDHCTPADDDIALDYFETHRPKIQSRPFASEQSGDLSSPCHVLSRAAHAVRKPEASGARIGKDV